MKGQDERHERSTYFIPVLQAAIAATEDYMVVLFRGTQEGADWWTNLKFLHRHFPALGRVHEVSTALCSPDRSPGSVTIRTRSRVPAEYVRTSALALQHVCKFLNCIYYVHLRCLDYDVCVDQLSVESTFDVLTQSIAPYIS